MKTEDEVVLNLATAPLKTARRSGFDGVTDPYPCKLPWPADCFVQCGGAGIVLGEPVLRKTAFFEAFPKDPNTFLRGEGDTVEAAEASCWKWFEKTRACPHDWERHGEGSTTGKCELCRIVVGNIFEPNQKCSICGAPTDFSPPNTGDEPTPLAKVLTSFSALEFSAKVPDGWHCKSCYYQHTNVGQAARQGYPGIGD